VPRSHSEKLRLLDALDRYVKEVTVTKKTNTQITEIKRAEQLKQSLGRFSMAALNSDRVARYRDQRLKEGKSANTVRLELALLSHLFAVAIREWGVGLVVNPVSNIRKPSPGEGRNRRLVGDEEQRLLAACDDNRNPMLGWIVRIALYTAMRHGEIISLRRNQVNLNKLTVFLPDTKNNDVRTVPLTIKAAGVFKQVLDHPVRPIDTDYLFYGAIGKDGKRRPYRINRRWEASLKKAGIENLRLHDLRHEATSRFVEAGLSDQEVASITGDKSMQMLKRYTHLRNEDLVGKIANI